MKKVFAFLALILVAGFSAFAQVGINASGSAPDPSAMLDVKSNTQGMLVPRMTAAERNAISNPANGLLIFCTDNNQYYTNKGSAASPNWMMMSSQWVTTGNDINYNSGNVGIGYVVAPALNLQVNGRVGAGYGSSSQASYTFSDGMENTGFASPSAFTIAFLTNGAERARFTDAGSLGIGTTLPAGSAIVDMTSTTQGFLPPRMTTTQRNAIVVPVMGLVIYNIDEKALNIFNGTSWAPIIPVVCGQSFTDTRNGKTYNTILIGTQCWMAQNLNIGVRINSTVNQTNNGTIEKNCYAENEANCAIYGGLYQWEEFMNYTTSSSAFPSGRQGICPTGWHIPSDAEFCQMEFYLDPTVNCNATDLIGTDAGGKMKETGLIHWGTPNTGATNASGFTGLGGGISRPGGGTEFLYATANFWTTTETSSTNALEYLLYSTYAQSGRAISGKTLGFSGRCLRD